MYTYCIDDNNEELASVFLYFEEMEYHTLLKILSIVCIFMMHYNKSLSKLCRYKKNYKKYCLDKYSNFITEMTVHYRIHIVLM